MKEPMIALSVRQPWAWALVTGRKDVENRTWMTSHRGRLWIHAAKVTPDPGAIAWIRSQIPHVSVPNHYATGALVGYVTLTDCLVVSDSPWYAGGCFAWVVTDAVALKKTVPMRGRQGLFSIDPADLR